MAKWTLLLFLALVLTVEGKGGRGGWGGRRGGRGSSSSSSSSGGWFSGLFGKSSSGAAAVPKPALGTVQKSSTGLAKKDLPSQNIGPGGYPVQKSQLSPPPYSPTNTHGTVGQTRVGPPAYHSPHGAPPSYYPGPQGNYHYAAPPAYSASHYGMSSSYNPPRNNFGYSGGYLGNSRPSYGGMGVHGNYGNYGYSGSGNWGGYGSYGAHRSSSTGSFLMGAASGYMASSLIHSITNPWRYSGYGYGHGYTDRYRYDRQPDTQAAAPDPTNNWINCVAYDPATNNTLINPNCTCTVSTTTDPATGQNISHHDCTPFAQQPPSLTPPDSIYGVNNPPPSFNGTLYGSSTSYGGGYPVGPPQVQSDALTGDGVQQKRMEFYSNLERLVNMGRFVR